MSVPLQKDKARVIAESVARRAFEVYAAVGGGGQSFERVHERGGFGDGEVIAFLYARTFPRAEWSERVREAFDGAKP